MVDEKISRREFLKLMASSSLLPVSHLIPDVNQHSRSINVSKAEGNNVIVILFDALSALHLSTYGYPRNTSSNISKFAENSIVFNRHYSAGNFTTPSTASFLTGMYPWRHRAFAYGTGVEKGVAEKNIFRMLAATHQQVAFTQNLFVDTLLRQFSEQIDQFLPLQSFSLMGSTIYQNITQKDALLAASCMDDFMFKNEETSGSLFLSPINDLISAYRMRRAEAKYQSDYPVGFPRQPKTNVVFTINEVLEGVMKSMKGWSHPFFAYLHFIPPHAPYKPRKEFLQLFNEDGIIPPEKPKHTLSNGITTKALNRARLQYDQYIANVDDEFGKLMTFLRENGYFDNSIILLTSDHGELFERGTQGHSTRLMYEPIMHIPLFASIPHLQRRIDVNTLTSTVDLMPTIMGIAGMEVPEWLEGMKLPELGGNADTERIIYCIEAKSNSAFSTLSKASIAMVWKNYKLIRYLGYPGKEGGSEFYDLSIDPEEMNDLTLTHPMAREMQEALEEKLEEVNRPYQ